MENNYQHFKQLMGQMLVEVREEITMLSRWLICMRQAHSWDVSLEGYMLERLHRMTLIIRELQQLLMKINEVVVNKKVEIDKNNETEENPLPC